MGCERCKNRDELDYCNLDDREKHFLVFMVGDCCQEMIMPDDFVRRFRGEIPREIKLGTRNGRSYTVGVAKYPDKLVLREGWGAFADTYDLRIEDCVVFRYKGNTQFDVIVFDRFGREKASSVIVDNAPLPSHVKEKHNSGTENLGRSHGHFQPMEMPSPTEYANLSERRHQPTEMPSPTEYATRSEGHHETMRMQLPTENVSRSEGHPQPMQMQPRTENSDSFAGISRPMEVQPPTGNVEIFCGHSQPTQRQQFTETLDHSNDHFQNIQVQLPRRGNFLPLADDIEVCDTPRYTLGWKTILNTLQKKEVDTKVQSINSDNPKFVAVMRNFNVTGTFTVTFSKQYVKTYVGDKERSICLQRLGKRWEVHFGGSPEVKRIVSGWRKFVQENDVEVGDICIFELLKIYEMCTMEVHIIHAKDFHRPSEIGDPRVQERREVGTKTVEHSDSRFQLVQLQLHNATAEDSPFHLQPMQMQSPSVEREIRVRQRNNWNQGNKGDSLMSEDIDHDTVALSGCMGVGLKHLTSIQKNAVKQALQLIDSEIPVCVVVMHKTNVTGRFVVSISKKYVDKYLGDEVRSIWLERHEQKYQVTLGRKPTNNRILGGWAKFVRDNKLETGDICLLELLRHCKLTAMKVHIIRAKDVS